MKIRDYAFVQKIDCGDGKRTPHIRFHPDTPKGIIDLVKNVAKELKPTGEAFPFGRLWSTSDLNMIIDIAQDRYDGTPWKAHPELCHNAYGPCGNVNIESWTVKDKSICRRRQCEWMFPEKCE